jgi:signal transduction histidine kinase/ActR/RegA family two-component response regulator
LAKREGARLLAVSVSSETDFLLARQRAKQIASVLGFEAQDQTRIATAVSEIARNAFEYAQGGKVAFFLEENDLKAGLRVVVSDSGKGIAKLEEILDGTYVSSTGMGLGIPGSRRLMDEFDVTSSDEGTTVSMVKLLPRGAEPPSRSAVAEKITLLSAQDLPPAERTQDQEILRLLTDLRDRERELTKLNRELEETNRGVMVLYSELEDRAIELQQASEMKTRFVSGITHELRTPLNSIVSLAGLLIRRIDGELTAEQEKQVLFIQRSALNLTEMVNDLLDLAKLEAGKVTVKLSEFTVKEVFAALRGMFRPLATNENVQLVFDDRLLGDTQLSSDEGKLAQILRNFISNALKFTERGSVQVSAEPRGANGVRFLVKDSGIGIADEDKELVWQEWGQVDSDTRPRHKGSGLGLPLSRQLATLLGGTTWFESTPGMGSIFYLEIPKAIAAKKDKRETVESDRTILIVDDDEVARYILRRNLVTLTSARLIEASSIVEAKRSLAANTPSLVFLDIVMPEENGLVFAEELRAAPETAQCPIVLISSKMLTAEEKTFIERHELTFINKESGDAEDKRVAIERELMNLGLCDLHQKDSAS